MPIEMRSAQLFQQPASRTCDVTREFPKTPQKQQCLDRLARTGACFLGAFDEPDRMQYCRPLISANGLRRAFKSRCRSFDTSLFPG